MSPHTRLVPASVAAAKAKAAAALACSAGGSGASAFMETSCTMPLFAPPPLPEADARAAAERAWP